MPGERMNSPLADVDKSKEKRLQRDYSRDICTVPLNNFQPPDPTNVIVLKLSSV